MKFEELNLSADLLRAVREEGYETATPIQQQAIPPVLAGRDLLGCAQTGTGKTAAFALPTMHRLAERVAAAASAPQSEDRSAEAPRQFERRPNFRDRNHGQRNERGGERRPVRVLVLAPTRELASQIAESFRTYGRHTRLRHAAIFGGVSQVPQAKAIERGVDILIATPGRLCDLMEQRIVNLSQVEVLILDEADQMLDMGFVPDLRRIVAQVPRNRQTLFFSATMPPEIRQLADQWLNNPVTVSVVPQGTTAERVEQALFFVPQRDKPQLLANYLRDLQCKRTLVFTRTKHGADKLVKFLHAANIRAEAIHGNKSQNARQRALALFKGQHPPVLVATDIASRGLDIDGVSHVVNFDLPLTPEAYVHRIGRTARAGAEGQAVLFVNSEERSMLREIERLTRQRISAVRLTGEAETPLAALSAEESRSAAIAEAPSEAPRERGGQRSRSFRGGRPAYAGQGQGQGRPFKGRQRSSDGAARHGSGEGRARHGGGHGGQANGGGHGNQGGHGGGQRHTRRTPR